MRLYYWAHKHAQAGPKRISLEHMLKVLGLGGLRDTEGNFLQEGPLPI